MSWAFGMCGKVGPNGARCTYMRYHRWACYDSRLGIAFEARNDEQGGS
jgi:hypothetical protein